MGLTFVRIPDNFICYKFNKTQYHKISWFLKGSGNGKFKKKNYNAVFLGSSQCYYGINDSILGEGYLNLGMNTPSRDLDLYLKEKFILSGGNSANYIVILGDGKFVSYGLHPLIPYLVNPSWLVSKGQSLISIHFWKYCTTRIQAVFDYFSWLLASKDIANKFNSRDFGVGYLDRITNKKQIVHSVYINPRNEPYVNSNAVSLFDEVRHNIKSQWNFMDCNEKLHNNKYLVIPGFESSNSFDLNKKNIVSFNREKIFMNVDIKNINDLLNDSIYWADHGHLNPKGSILFTKIIKIN
jgi:hypothetical protein